MGCTRQSLVKEKLLRYVYTVILSTLGAHPCESVVQLTFRPQISQEIFRERGLRLHLQVACVRCKITRFVLPELRLRLLSDCYSEAIGSTYRYEIPATLSDFRMKLP